MHAQKIDQKLHVPTCQCQLKTLTGTSVIQQLMSFPKLSLHRHKIQIENLPFLIVVVEIAGTRPG